MSSTSTDTSEVAILRRLLRPETPTFSPQGAKDILAIDFPDGDKERMRELSAKARVGELSAAEDAEAGRYELLGHLLGIMQSKARRSLESQPEEGARRPRTR